MLPGRVREKPCFKARVDLYLRHNLSFELSVFFLSSAPGLLISLGTLCSGCSEASAVVQAAVAVLSQLLVGRSFAFDSSVMTGATVIHRPEKNVFFGVERLAKRSGMLQQDSGRNSSSDYLQHSGTQKRSTILDERGALFDPYVVYSFQPQIPWEVFR